MSISPEVALRREAAQVLGELNAEISKNIILPDHEREVLVGAFAIGAHILDEGAPGTGKTHLANTFGRIVDNFAVGRVQGTPETTSNDIIGVSIPRAGTGRSGGLPKFDLFEGPLLKANLLHVDEGNRMNTRVQAALLEGMQEGKVTVFGQDYELQKPFVTMFTQNPNEIGQGTNPLTKAQRDRFTVSVEQPALSEAAMIAVDDLNHEPAVVADIEELVKVAAAARTVEVSREMKERAARLVVALRSFEGVDPLESTLDGARGIQHTLRMARVRALRQGRVAVTQEDIYRTAMFTLPHRIGMKFEAENITSKDIVFDAISSIIKPTRQSTK